MQREAMKSEQVFRFRPDIEWTELRKKGDRSWIARDPLTLEFYYFSDLEYRIARALDGQSDLRKLMQLDARVSLGWLTRLLLKFENSGLTVPRAIGATGSHLFRLQERNRRRGALGQLLNPLTIRVKLLDPTQILERLNWVARLLFSLPTVCIVVLSTLLIGFAAANQYAMQPIDLPKLLAHFSVWQFVFAGTLYLAIKSLHEMGHALACKRWNAECHEIGIMFLVFFPYLYCDTTDSWKLASPYRRAAVAAAGIYVEMILATVGAAVWLVAVPGTFIATLAAQVMLMCSLNTLFVNGNPLLRYDGYYILADLLQIPNLGQQSASAFKAYAASWLSGSPKPRRQWDGKPSFLITYATLSWCYRLFLTFMIVWMVWLWFDQLGIPLIAAWLAIIAFSNLLVSNIMSVLSLAKSVASAGKLSTFRISAFGLAVFGSLLLFFQVPLPTFVVARAVTSYAKMSPIYAQEGGVLEYSAGSDRIVEQGETLVRLHSSQLKLDLLRVRNNAEVLQVRFEQLNQLSIEDESVTVELATVAEELTNAKLELRKLQDSLKLMVIEADYDGVLRAASNASNRTFTERPGHDLPRPVIDQMNLGRWIDKGEQLAWLCGDDLRLDAFVTEEAVELLSTGMPVRCRWDSHSGTTHHGTIIKIGTSPTETVPEPLVGDPELPSEPRADSSFALVGKHYTVRIELDSLPDTVLPNSLATVHFETAPRTLAESAKRIFEQTILPSFR